MKKREVLQKKSRNEEQNRKRKITIVIKKRVKGKKKMIKWIHNKQKPKKTHAARPSLCYLCVRACRSSLTSKENYIVYVGLARARY